MNVFYRCDGVSLSVEMGLEQVLYPPRRLYMSEYSATVEGY